MSPFNSTPYGKLLEKENGLYVFSTADVGTGGVRHAVRRRQLFFLDIFVCEYGAAEEYTFIIRNGNGWKS